MSKKIQVSFSDAQLQLLELLKGEMGDSDADVVRGIVLSWLAEKGLISDVAKMKLTAVDAQNLQIQGTTKGKDGD